MSTHGYDNPPQVLGEEESTASRVADKAKEGAAQGQEVAQNAAGSAKEVANTAAMNAQQVAGEARQQAGQLAQEVTTHARSILDDASVQLREQAVALTERAAQAFQQISDELSALVSGRTQEAGKTGEYAQELGDRLSSAADRMRARGVDGLMDDLRDLGRNRPGTFLLGAGALGFGIGRLLRGAKAASNEMGTGGYEPQGNAQGGYLQPGITTEIDAVDPLRQAAPYRPQGGAV